MKVTVHSHEGEKAKSPAPQARVQQIILLQTCTGVPQIILLRTCTGVQQIILLRTCTGVHTHTLCQTAKLSMPHKMRGKKFSIIY